jgi:hypothetical protein
MIRPPFKRYFLQNLDSPQSVFLVVMKRRIQERPELGVFSVTGFHHLGGGGAGRRIENAITFVEGYFQRSL